MGRGGPDHEAAELLAGNDVRPRAASLLGRALGGIPEQARAEAARHDRLRMRADAGYFTAELAHTTLEHGCVAIEVREALCLQDGDHVLLCRVRHHVAYGIGRPVVQTLIPGARQPSRCAVT